MKPVNLALGAILFSGCASSSAQRQASARTTNNKAVVSYNERPTWEAKKSASVPRVLIEFPPVLDDDGRPQLDESGEPIINYIRADATVDENDDIEISRNVVVRTIPPTPHIYLGTLVSSRGAVDTVTPSRVVTDERGRFRATVRTKNAKGGYSLKIE